MIISYQIVTDNHQFLYQWKAIGNKPPHQKEEDTVALHGRKIFLAARRRCMCHSMCTSASHASATFAYTF
jgi:hypothetical protein